MTIKGFKNHPYIPNSVPEVQKQMLQEIGLENLEDLHAEIPDALKLKENMALPPALAAEYELRRHIEKILRKNHSGKDHLIFLGGGCWPHYVPAICDEINSRGEFLTGYAGEAYNDHGRFQTLFEYQSMVAELVDMEVVNVPTMDWAQAAATSMRMAGRMTKRSQVLVPSLMDPEKLKAIRNYCDPTLEIVSLKHHPQTGQIDLMDLQEKLSDSTAAVYFENPGYLGFFEEQGEGISKIAKEAGALTIVGVDPSSLGIIAPPSQYGADIICGELQPLGIHMHYGGGLSGFIATRDEEAFVMQYPSRLFGIAPTTHEGEYGFGDVSYNRTSFGDLRENANEYVGTQTSLWAITAGVYLAAMGPKGMQELGETILQRVLYTMDRMKEIPGVKLSPLQSSVFKEFVVDFNHTGKTVSEINEALRKHHIFGGKDLSEEFPSLGQCALYCVTEIHNREDIDQLVNAIKTIVGKEG
ncbi:glycine dehydrogenase subunit 1 [Tindallia magadiensis]|uniref:Glycine dehydrogenase subunit 1 n=1 Tax=Tindallia magadiensis TaxID=69895 RepID=A0A1I3EX72_9FIRM|nr:aminomethyl-transferring glycine dehydrogenase subunit GcvPA [Tindallia magadiensis]SFI03589.1 glycine dehydrogenase subunit 1 [Tindallia magadiensis]